MSNIFTLFMPYIDSAAFTSGMAGSEVGIALLVMAIVAVLAVSVTFIAQGRWDVKKITFYITGKNTDFDKVVDRAGYAYDKDQDIFYSVINPWQRKYGYCKLYDEACAPFGMIVDCEPIYFNYDNKKWLIEFWKGQYGLSLGAEVGIYNTTGEDIISDIVEGDFYYVVDEKDYLNMSFILRKGDKVICKREGIHWWLTGFAVGEFANPSELTMDITITLKDIDMTEKFVDALRKVGYRYIEVNDTTVSLVYNKPFSPQPFTRNEETDELIQKKNKLMCDAYERLTLGGETFPDKMKILKDEAYELYELATNMGRTSDIFSAYNNIKNI